MKKLFLLLPILLLFLTSCDEPQSNRRRVVLVYMEAQNNLFKEALDDLKEMRRGDIPADCRLLVYRSRRGDDNPALIEIFKGGDSVLMNFPDTVSALDPEHMQYVIYMARRLAPSREFGMVFWSHASGWRQKQAPARGFGSENGVVMPVSELAKGLDRWPEPMEFLFFDCCYMGCAEVAYELRNRAKYFVASVCEVPGGGMPYQLTLGELFNPDTKQGLKNAIDLTVDYYENQPQERCPSTLSLIDLKRMDALLEAVRPTVDKHRSISPYYVWQRFSLNAPYSDMFTDLGQYMELFKTQIPDGVILHERHKNLMWGQPLKYCSGLSIFFPDFRRGNEYDFKGYDTLEWAQKLGLDNTDNTENK